MPIPAISFKGGENVFGEEFEKDNISDIEYYRKISDAMMDTMDAYQPSEKEEDKKNKKNILGVALSLATAGILAFVGGKIITDKLSQIFPKTAGAASKKLAKFADGEFLNKVTGFFEKHSTVTEKVNAGKIGKWFRNKKASASKLVVSALNWAKNGLKSEKALSNLGGAALAAAGVSRIATVDGNGDGVKDITQKNVNAYKSAIQGIDILEAITKTIS